jgi:hypothetical protein
MRFSCVCVERGLASHALELLLPPALVVLVGDVVELSTNGATISLSKGIEQLSQTRAVTPKERVAGIKYSLLVRISKTIESGIQLWNVFALSAL